MKLGKLIIDISLRDQLEAEFTHEFRRPTENRRRIAELVTDSRTRGFYQLGASDAGAHVTQKCGTGETTDILQHFVDDRRGGREGEGGTGLMGLEEAVYEMTGKNAQQWGIKDRGTIEVGKAADLVIFDLNKVGNKPNEYVADVPGGQSRYYRRADGFAAVWVNGVLVYEDGEYKDGVAGVGQVV